MYHSEFFYQEPSDLTSFNPHVLSAWQIMADNDYHYERNKYEKDFYPEGTYAIIRTIHGAGQLYTVDGTMILLEENTFLCIKLDDIARYQAVSQVWKYNWVNFSSNVHQVAFEMDKLYFLQPGEFEELIFQRLLRHGKGVNPYPPQVDSIFMIWFYHIYGQRYETITAGVNSNMLNRIKAHIEQNMFTKLTVSDIAAEFHFSPRRIDQIFQQELHMTPKQYLCNKKMEKAKNLLTETQITIKEISNVLGYSSPYHFSREFKSHVGVPPKEYRKESLSLLSEPQMLR